MGDAKGTIDFELSETNYGDHRIRRSEARAVEEKFSESGRAVTTVPLDTLDDTLAAAPHNLTATITMPKSRDSTVTNALLERFPSATVIAVRDLIGRVGTLLDQMASAIFAAAAIAILAGVAVLIGAIAARWGGCAPATANWEMPENEMPTMPTLPPLTHGWAATTSTAS